MQMMWRATAIGSLSVIFAAGALAAQAVTLAIPSEILGTERAVYVRLPIGYEMRSDSYPVLYFTDGEATDSIVVPIVDSLSRAETVPEMILVGIPHPDRRSDLTPTALQSRPGSGGGEDFFRFIAEELIPYMDANYRTRPTRVLAGHSLGGLFSAFVMVRDPGLFAGYIASSPVISWDDWYVRELADARFTAWEDRNTFLALSVGSEEEPRFLDAGKEFAAWLEQNAPGGLRWSFRVYDGQDHMSVWPHSLRDGLVEFFSQPDGGPAGVAEPLQTLSPADRP
jgi:predicted alpha/beta superfamily hydrolase